MPYPSLCSSGVAGIVMGVPIVGLWLRSTRLGVSITVFVCILAGWMFKRLYGLFNYLHVCYSTVRMAAGLLVGLG